MAQVTVSVKIGGTRHTETFFVDAVDEDQALDDLGTRQPFKAWATDLLLEHVEVEEATYDIDEGPESDDEPEEEDAE